MRHRALPELVFIRSSGLALLACGGDLGSNDPVEPDYEIRAELGTAQALHGGSGGEPFRSLCPDGRVLVGIRAVGAEDLWGLGVNCGRLDLLRTNEGYGVDVVPLDQLSLFGGNVAPAPPVISYECPPEMVVTAVSWSLLVHEGWDQPVVKQMTLTCSELAIDAALELTRGPTTAILDAGVVREGLEAFPHSCGTGGAVNGFTGRSGAALDALSTNCVTLSVHPL